MEQNNITLVERKKVSTRLSKSSKLYKCIVNAIKDKKGEDIISLDLKKIVESVSDYFVLCDARSHIQVKAIADYIITQTIDECDEKPYHVEYGDNWTIIDYVNIVIHVFQHEQRLFYNLEGLWEDAIKTEY